MKTGRGWWALAGMVAASMAMYVAAYYSVVVPAKPELSPTVVPLYPDRGRLMEAFFEPIHQIDRVIRPQAWDPRLVRPQVLDLRP